jgi:uncharacterized protein
VILKTDVRYKYALLSVLPAAVLWFLLFVIKPLNFWLEMSLSIVLLSAIAVFLNKGKFQFGKISLRHILIGVLSAILLYLVFYAGNIISGYILPFKNVQVMSVYNNKAGVDLRLISFLLVLIIGPGEELYWRGFIQNTLSAKHGSRKGFLLGTALYAGVHILTGNFMLVVAALVCGLFWGFIYEKEKSLVPVIISHVIWDLSVFVLFPLM